MRFTEIETERLLLRKYSMEDLHTTRAYSADPETIRFVHFNDDGEDATKLVLTRFIERAKDDECTNFQYAVVEKDSGNHIGGANISSTENETWEVGWMLNRAYQRRGYGTEIARALIKFGFESLGAHRIAATCNAENIASYRVMEKAGMRREGLFIKSRRGNRVLNNEWCDVLSYAVLREETR
jgi:RimJ/RimL family protein N-acetyltransferase